ncbi:hypothetical protein [Cytophaga sp. FL35]|uniref:hypothetical protein n=1 Tax=Cytophaga sp. FL35 TaxID=1904456 RepID=UPI0016538351|nr:hypothetical protein [Cytophaga sp. FL35]MBC7000000.1 hypothetical protein [Cytophaga sp. FL35]
MEKDELDILFKNLQGEFDIENPSKKHQDRFLEKLNSQQGTIPVKIRKATWWKPLSIAASFLLIGVLTFLIYPDNSSLDEQVAEIAPEVSKTEFYFANLIEQQVTELKTASSPETKQLVDDAMNQLNKLEQDYKGLEQDLINGGNSKMILSAMITNFQTRIDLLQDVLARIESIKKTENNDDEISTI